VGEGPERFRHARCRTVSLPNMRKSQRQRSQEVERAAQMYALHVRLSIMGEVHLRLSRPRRHDYGGGAFVRHGTYLASPTCRRHCGHPKGAKNRRYERARKGFRGLQEPHGDRHRGTVPWWLASILIAVVITCIIPGRAVATSSDL